MRCQAFSFGILLTAGRFRLLLAAVYGMQGAFSARAIPRG